MEYVADRQEYLKPSRALRRMPNFRETSGHEEWPAPAMHRVSSGLVFVDRWEDEDESADIVLYADEPVRRLRKLYEFRNDAAVKAFLEENADLVHLLPSTYDKVREYFGSGARLILKVSNDPDAREDRQLFVLIQTKLRPKAARTLMSELDRGWWHGVFPATKGRMTISLEYV